jgi:hypothetical protein
MGLAPTRVVRTGQTDHARPGWVAKLNLWEHQTPEISYATAQINEEEHLRPLADLASIVHARRNELFPLIGPGELYFYTVTYSDSPNVISHLPRETAQMVNELGATWYSSVWVVEAFNDQNR